MKNYTKVLARLMVLVGITVAFMTPCIGNKDQWKDLSIELRTKILNGLLQDGDYNTFVNDHAVSPSMKEAIDANPVLIATLRGINQLKDKDIQEILYGRPVLSRERMEALINKVKQISSKEASSESDQTQVFSNLMGWIISATHKALIERPASAENFKNASITIASNVNNKDLEQLDRSLITYILNLSPYNKDMKYNMLAKLLLALTKNHNIPTDFYIKRIKAVPNNYFWRDKFDDILLSLANRSDLGPETIQYFKEHQSNPNWLNNKNLSKVLETIKQNPAYSANG